MNKSCLINVFASKGFLLNQDAISYLQTHDYKEVLELFTELSPETIVITLPEIRKIHRATRTKNAISVRVTGFKQKCSWNVYDDIERLGRKTLLKALEKTEANL
jgi:hypothetical protein